MITKSVPYPTVPKVIENWEAYLSALTAEERGLAEKARYHHVQGTTHELCARIFVGRLALKLSERQDKYGEKLIYAFAEQSGLSTDLIYEAKRIVERIPSTLLDDLLIQAETAQSSTLLTKQHLVVLTNKRYLPPDAEEKQAWLKEQITQVVNENLSAARTKLLLEVYGGSLSGAARAVRNREMGLDEEVFFAGETAPKPKTPVLAAAKPLAKWVKQAATSVTRWREALVQAVEDCRDEGIRQEQEALAKLHKELEETYLQVLTALAQANKLLEMKQARRKTGGLLEV